MLLHLLPTRTAGAAENMATDFLLLQRYPQPATPRFRHYGWRTAAFTFGYSQRIAFVRANLPPDGTFDLCRRPTGGGIVDHRDDWTYALVIPRGHELEERPASESYRLVHEALAAALAEQGRPARVNLEPPPPVPLASAPAGGVIIEDAPALAPGNPGVGVCFQRAERYDVIDGANGAKIAGAAQKRNKHGLLFQGSIERGAAGPVDWEAFHAAFAAGLARALGADAEETPWPELNEDELSGLVEQYSSPGWLEHR